MDRYVEVTRGGDPLSVRVFFNPQHGSADQDRVARRLIQAVQEEVQQEGGD